jgi:hypothetical protein
MSESNVHLDEIFEKFRKAEVDLQTLGDGLTAKIRQMLEWVRSEGEKVFDDYPQLLKQVDTLKEITPHTDHLVLHIENWRHLLEEPEKLAQHAIIKSNDSEVAQALQRLEGNVTQQPVQGEYGMWRYAGDVKKMNTLMKLADKRIQPQATTSSRQRNFLDYARDIPPELNKLYSWLPRMYLKLLKYGNKEKRAGYFVLHIYLEQLAALAQGFCGAIIQLRIELVGQRELAYAQAMTALEQARIMAAAGMKVSGPEPGDSLTELLKENLRRRS